MFVNPFPSGWMDAWMDGQMDGRERQGMGERRVERG